MRDRRPWLFGAAVALAIAVPVTVAQFSGAFTVTSEASGAIDIAQTKTGDAGQHATAKQASTLEGNGRLVGTLPAGSSGWPERSTAAVDVPVFNRSAGAVATRLIVGATAGGEDVASHLIIGASVDGAPVGDAPVPGGWFAEHPDGLPLGSTLGAGKSRTVTVSVWLVHDAPATMLGTDLEISLQVVGETEAGDRPILVEGIWK